MTKWWSRATFPYGMIDVDASQVITVDSVAKLGALVRERRRASGLTQAQAAGLMGVGTRFLSELERGKKTLEIDRVLMVLQRVGIELLAAPRGAPILRALLSPSGDLAQAESARKGRRG